MQSHAVGKTDPLVSVLIQELVADRPIGRLILTPVRVNLLADIRGQLVGDSVQLAPRKDQPRYPSINEPR